MNDPLWYKDGAIYEAHVKSFYDSNNDGIGDFNGLTQKFDYLQGLGVTCLWLLPFLPSPLKDDGYDVADCRNVHPSYGNLSALTNSSGSIGSILVTGETSMAKRPSARSKVIDPAPPPVQPKPKRARAATARSPEPSADDVRRRAYERYLERGGRHGQHFDDWLEAEKELRRKKT